MTLNKYYPDSEAVSKSSIGKQLEMELRIRIISQDISKETVLSENQLANEYQISRSPVREALRVLEKEKLLRLERMGVIITGISEADIEEIYDIRLLIESFVVNRLLESENNDLLIELNKIAEMMKVSIRYGDIDEFSKQDMKFHETIIYSINHQQIAMVWDQLKPVMECLVILSMRYRGLTNYDDFSRVIHNHQLIIQALSEKKTALVEDAFDKNFNDVQNKVESFWRSPEMLKKARDYSG
ncbi:MAG TPA: GntR family transcriptional regulator [Virgibacillus sp.]|nr:GntR family transcriptional regulator [Virgibacillus sp.]HLR69196.1 GntR family transcriptional regulator [Virgibacillus sp.]